MIVLLNVYIYICALMKKSVPLFPGGTEKIYTPGTIENLQTDWTLTKTNKNGAVVSLRILVELEIL